MNDLWIALSEPFEGPFAYLEVVLVINSLAVSTPLGEGVAH